jgi:hypothetical protein
MRGSRGLSIIAGLTLLLGAADASGADPRIFLPEEIYNHRFAAAVSGAEALWINPAALTVDPRVHVQYNGEYRDGSFGDSWGWALAGDGIGIAYRKIDDFMGERYSEYIFGAGVDMVGAMSLGASYRYVKKGFDYYHKRHLWNVGVLIDNGKALSMAAVFSNLNRGRVAGEKSQIEELYCITYRPGPEWLSLSMEIMLSSKQSLSSAKYNYGVELSPMEGVNLYASVKNNRDYRLGIVYSFTDYFFGAQSRRDADNAHLGTTTSFGLIRELR